MPSARSLAAAERAERNVAFLLAWVGEHGRAPKQGDKERLGGGAAVGNFWSNCKANWQP